MFDDTGGYNKKYPHNRITCTQTLRILASVKDRILAVQIPGNNTKHDYSLYIWMCNTSIHLNISNCDVWSLGLLSLENTESLYRSISFKENLKDTRSKHGNLKTCFRLIFSTTPINPTEYHIQNFLIKLQFAWLNHVESTHLLVAFHTYDTYTYNI